MSTLAVIGTFYKRPWAVPRIAEAMRAQTRQPDEIFLMYEYPDHESERALVGTSFSLHLDTIDEAMLPCAPELGQNPLAVEVNTALDLADADYIAYLTDDSLPDPRKYEVMARALDENPEWGAVYCSQDYGFADSPEDWLAGGRPHSVRHANGPQPDPYSRVDHTQVMHRRCEARWPLARADAALSDAHFFRDLVAEKGPLMPVPEVLDWTRQLPDGLSVRR